MLCGAVFLEFASHRTAATMPLVKVDAADDYLDVAHLAEEKGDGGKKKGTAGGRQEGKKTGTGGDDGGNHLDADAMVDVPAFSSHDGPRAPAGLFSPAGISSMIAPRYLSRDSHARPRDVQVAGPHDSSTSLDDNVSVITLETCLRQMETSGASISAELGEKEMAMAAARGEYNARIAAMSRQNSEVQGGGGDGGEGDVGVGSGKVLPKVADALERQNAYGTNRSENRRKGDLGRSGTDRSSPTGRGYRGDGRDQHHHHQQPHHHHKDSSVAGSRSSRPHNRSSLQDRYSSNANVSGRTHLTHDSRTSAPNSRQLHRHLNTHNDHAASMRTIESEASHSVVSGAESRASHFTHNTSEGLGASMWSASRSKGDRRKEQHLVRSRNRDRGQEIMSRVLQEEEGEEEAEAEAAEAETRSGRSRDGSDEEEKKEGGGGAIGTSSHNHQLNEENQVSSFSDKEIARRRDYLTKKNMLEQERSDAEVAREERFHDGPGSLVEIINRRARNATVNPLRRLSLHSLDDELDSVESDVEGSSGLPPPPQSAATRMKSASISLSNLAAEVSYSAKHMSTSAERGARGFLNRHSNIDDEAARRISDLEAQVATLREAFQMADDHCATLEGRLVDTSSDRDRAEDLIRLLEAENDALKKRVEELERREFGRAMGMTSGKAGATSNNGGSFTVALNDTDTDAKGEDPLKGSLDAIRKNRVQPFRQGSVKSFNPMQDFDLESVVSEREPPRSTASVATDKSGDSSPPIHGNDEYDYQDQERSYEHRGGYESDDGSENIEDIEDQLRALPSENPNDNRFMNQEKDKGSVPNGSAEPQKRGIFGLGKLMSNLHNESFAILETLQEENAGGAAKPQQANRPNGVHARRHTVDDPADVANEISHKLSTDIREWGNAGGKDTRSAQRLPIKSTASGETAATSSMTNSTPPHQTHAGGESWFRRQRNNIAKGVNESLRNTGGMDEASLAGHSVVSQGGFSMNLAMKDELR